MKPSLPHPSRKWLTLALYTHTPCKWLKLALYTPTPCKCIISALYPPPSPLFLLFFYSPCRLFIIILLNPFIIPLYCSIFSFIIIYHYTLYPTLQCAIQELNTRFKLYFSSPLSLLDIWCSTFGTFQTFIWLYRVHILKY